MDYRRANRAFLYTILSTLALSFLLSYYILFTGFSIPIIINNILSEAVVLLPTLAVVLFSGDRLSSVIPFKKIRISSFLLTIVYLLLLFPLVTFVNYLSMFFVQNMVDSISGDVLALPVWQILLSMGVIGPFIEEIIFRGVFLQSYQRSGRIIGSIILSSILFGMMHLNFNQFAYGTVMGIMFSLLVEATGSVLSSFVAHGLFNSIEIIIMFATSSALSEADEMLDTYTSSNESMMLMLGIYFVLAIIFTAVAMVIINKIAEIEGREEFMKSIPLYPRQGYKLITVPLVIAIVISLAYMTFIASI